jgi:hypothetical protein
LPNVDAAVQIEDEIISTIDIQTLIDGSQGVTEPEKTYNLQPITFTWSRRYKTTLETRIENYIKSGSGLKLTMHTGKQFIGQFRRLNTRWKPSGDTTDQRYQKYYLTVEFQQLETDMLRDQQW